MPSQKKRKQTLSIPNSRGIYDFGSRSAKRWFKSDNRSFRSQAFTPKRSPVLLKKLGIKRDSHIFFFAGFSGTWGAKLAEAGARVHYSDVSRHSLALARESGAAKLFEGMRLLEGSQWPRKSGKYDWSFSFEPIPMVGSGGLTLALMRSLLNRKGAKVVYSIIFPYEAKKTASIARQLSGVYGANFKTKEVVLETTKEWPIRKMKYKVLTIKTNDRARKLAWQDVQLLKAIDLLQRKHPNSKISVADIVDSARVKRLGFSERRVLDGLSRLNRLAKLFEKNSRFFKGLLNEIHMP